jgi:hypothetical protein
MEVCSILLTLFTRIQGQSPIVLGGAARHIRTHGQAGLKLAPVLPIKRRRTEISASPKKSPLPLKLGSPSAVGRHTKNSENLISYRE